MIYALQNVQLQTSNLHLETGSIINVTGKGFPAQSGPGPGNESTGASHGGYGGGLDAGPAYGSYYSPRMPGSGGGTVFGGSGGGTIFVSFHSLCFFLKSAIKIRF